MVFILLGFCHNQNIFIKDSNLLEFCVNLIPPNKNTGFLKIENSARRLIQVHCHQNLDQLINISYT